MVMSLIGIEMIVVVSVISSVLMMVWSVLLFLLSILCMDEEKNSLLKWVRLLVIIVMVIDISGIIVIVNVEVMMFVMRWLSVLWVFLMMCDIM